MSSTKGSGRPLRRPAACISQKTGSVSRDARFISSRNEIVAQSGSLAIEVKVKVKAGARANALCRTQTDIIINVAGKWVTRAVL